MVRLWATAVKLLTSSSRSLPFSKGGILYIARGWSHFLGGHASIDHVRWTLTRTHTHTHSETL